MSPFKPLLIIFLLGYSLNICAQRPVIYYGEHHFFYLDSTQVLAPVQSGGSVPKKKYGSTSTFAGTGLPSLTDGSKNKAGFNLPSAIAIDAHGNVYIADEKNNSIRKITPDGVVHTLINKGLNGPSGIAVDHNGNIYVADCNNHEIKKIQPSGLMTVLAGSGKAGDLDHKTGTKAMFKYPVSITLDRAGNVYVSDEGNNKIKKIGADGSVKTIAGSGVAGSEDHINGKLAKFNQPNGLAIDSLGNLYVADQLNHKIRVIDLNGSVSTFSGTGMAGFINHQIATLASFNNPRGLAIDASGNMYVGDVGNQQIRKINSFGEVSTLAGSGVAGMLDHDKGQLANFYFPNGIAVDHDGDLLVADGLNHKIRKVEATGYEIIPDLLPPGLSFDASTGIVSGQPKRVTTGANYNITAYNAHGSYTTKLNMDISGQPGNALSFDGFDDQLIINDNPLLTPNQVTLELWVNISKISTYARFLVKRNDKRRYDDSYSIGVDSLGYFRAVMANGNGLSGSQVFAYSKHKATLNQWYFVSAIYTNDSLSLYLNGELQEKRPTGFPISKGENELAFGFDKSLAYLVDEVRIFKTDRSAFMRDDFHQAISSANPDLVAYYNFNTGWAGGTNTSATRLYDLSSNEQHGRLNNFAVAGNKSNWVESLAMVVPRALSAQNISDSGFTARWTAPNPGKADLYLLDVSEDPDFCTFLDGYEHKEIVASEALVSLLKPKHKYYYRLSAYNKMTKTNGVYSEAIQVTTK